jgi:FMN phosphatase YigB (HAD superfamily)
VSVLNAVLFDFSDTLFWRDGPARLSALLADHEVHVEAGSLSELWSEVKRESVTPHELAKCRDTSAEAHRRCWTELLQPFNAFHPHAAELLYADQPNPIGWHTYDDTVEVLTALHERGIPIGVVSDIGWDLRPIFAHHGVDHVVSAWVLSFEHGTEKPDPHMFELGCEGLGSRPSNTLMVGDSVEKDAGAARAGLTSLTLPAHHGVGERGLRHALTLLSSNEPR